ncbi:unnamed protein product [Ixodes pacificus]
MSGPGHCFVPPASLPLSLAGSATYSEKRPSSGQNLFTVSHQRLRGSAAYARYAQKNPNGKKRRSSPSNYNDVKLKLLQESAGSLEFRDTDVLYPSDPNSVSYATGPMQDDVYGAAVGSTQLGSMMDLQHGGQHVQDAQGQDPDGKKKRKHLRL